MKDTLNTLNSSLSRRRFVQAVGIGAAGAWIGARGREASLFAFEQAAAPAGRMLILSSNENPLGPGQTVLNAVRGAFGLAGRYPFATAGDVAKAIAERQKVKIENVLLGVGSTQILRTCTHVFTSKERGLATALPAYEECSQYAELVGAPVKGVSLDSNFTWTLAPCTTLPRGWPRLYCNPKNRSRRPSRENTRDFIEKVRAIRPTRHPRDEAYFDYATLPGYETMIPLAVENPRVVVARRSPRRADGGARSGTPWASADVRRMASGRHRGDQRPRPRGGTCVGHAGSLRMDHGGERNNEARTTR